MVYWLASLQAEQSLDIFLVYKLTRIFNFYALSFWLFLCIITVTNIWFIM